MMLILFSFKEVSLISCIGIPTKPEATLLDSDLKIKHRVSNDVAHEAPESH